MTILTKIVSEKLPENYIRCRAING